MYIYYCIHVNFVAHLLFSADLVLTHLNLPDLRQSEMERLRELSSERDGVILAHTQQTWPTNNSVASQNETLNQTQQRNEDTGQVESRLLSQTESVVLGRRGKDMRIPETLNTEDTEPEILNKQRNVSENCSKRSALISAAAFGDSSEDEELELPNKRSKMGPEMEAKNMGVQIHNSQDPGTSGINHRKKRLHHRN